MRYAAALEPLNPLWFEEPTQPEDVEGCAELARRIGKPKAVRAAGLANSQNPISIVVPCHRVIGSNGSLTGYGGAGPIRLAYERGEVNFTQETAVGISRSVMPWVQAGWKGPRRVLNISSGLGRNAMASQAPYCAAKAGLDHFTRCCALEELHQPHGAKLVSLAPGVIDTDMQIHLRGSEAQAFPDRQRFVDLREKGMLSSPEDAATRVLAWLDRSDFGQNPVADVRDA